MFYVYLLRSISFPKQTYIGFTADLKRRVADHNSGSSPHTSKFRPWKLVCYHAFDEKQRALDFERYLKSGSGQAFAKRRLWENASRLPFV
ncbi:GIY-YIG nuclease family protein [Breoghania sp. JC706]|uniref:GIY-YIG nuclease family protein n=1 Tax=Breoghania sp. JC706 TaxID=3117732 RepID=UPI003008433B